MAANPAYAPPDEFVIVRRFVHMPRAAVCQAKLRENAIECFISNAHTGTLIPFANGGFLLHVRERDREQAEEILAEHDKLAESRPEEDFKDADFGDIAYQKAISDYERRLNSGAGKVVGFVLIAAFIVACLVLLILRFRSL